MSISYLEEYPGYTSDLINGTAVSQSTYSSLLKSIFIISYEFSLYQKNISRFQGPGMTLLGHYHY